MSTKQERDIRAEAIATGIHRRQIRGREIMCALLGILFAGLMIFSRADITPDVSRAISIVSAFCFCAAALYNLYGNLFIRPRMLALQGELNHAVEQQSGT